MINPLSLPEVEYIAFRLAKEQLDWDEPIPAFSTCYPNKLESCITTPFMKIGGRNVYKGLEMQSAALFYYLIKSHPFQNGNKRIAVTTLLVFLLKHKKWIQIDNQELYNFAVWVAESPAKMSEDVIKIIAKFIKQHSTKIA